jgi:hypothetical protein
MRSIPWRRCLVFGVKLLLAYYLIYAVLFIVDIKGPIYNQIQEHPLIQRSWFGRSWDSMDRTKPYDLLFLGSSHCFCSLDPRVFEKGGYRAHNLGGSLQTPLNSWVLFRSVKANTKGILLEVYPLVSNGGGEEAFNYMIPNVDDWGMLTHMAWEVNHLRAWQNLSVKPLVDTLWRDRPNFDQMPAVSGFMDRNVKAPADQRHPSQQLSPEGADYQLRYVERIVKECRASGLWVGFVYAPIPKELKIVGEMHFIHAIEKLSKKYGVPYYNLGHHHELSSVEDFFDMDHLNTQGAKWASETVVERLKKDYPLK